MLAVESDKAKSTILFGSVILGYVDVPDLPVLGEEILDVLDVGAVREPVHLQADHLAGIWGRSSERHFKSSRFCKS